MSICVDILQYSMPLAFLPSVLEDRGHSTIKIASAIGVYYWTGFAGGLCITMYQIYRLISASGGKVSDLTTLATARSYVRYLIYGLTVGTVTLFVQAIHPHYNAHLGCRFLQGFAGAFIFFYSFLLSVALFEAQSKQQDFAMTAASCSLNVAEVLGSLFGAVIFEAWGQRTVFCVLGVASVINQVVLVVIMFQLEADDHGPEDMSPSSPAFGMSAWGASPVSTTPSDAPPERRWKWKKLWRLLQGRRLACAVLLIVMSAVVKGAVEEMLPFHADHRWGMDPLAIGQLFAIVATAYIISAFAIGRVWRELEGFRVVFSAAWVALLGIGSLMTFCVAAFDLGVSVLWGGLAFYGVCLGLTHTPAALFLADAIDHEEGVAKDAVNAIWNTMWEAGGSLGFLAGGLLGHHYPAQLRLLVGTSIACCIVGVVMFFLQPSSKGEKSIATPREGSKIPIKNMKDTEDYGSAA